MRLQRSELNICFCHSNTEQKESIQARGKRVPLCLPSQLQEEEEVTAEGSFTSCMSPPPHLAALPILHPAFLQDFKAVSGIVIQLTPAAAHVPL